MTCNCNKEGDVKYTITLNQQGPQGRQGNAGQTGFSPIVDVYSNSGTNYQLRIITKDGEIITPNLKGQADTTQFVTINTNQDIYSQKTFNEPTTFKSNLNMKNDLWMVNKEDTTSSLIQQTRDGLRFAYTGKAMFEYPIETQQVILKDGSYTTPITQSTNHLFIGNSNNTNDVYIRGNTFAKASQNSSELSRVVTQTNLVSGNGISIATYTDGRVEISSIGLTTEAQFDELANDVVGINSALGGLSFKKYTAEEYASIANPDANTLYMVTNPDGNTFKLYLGSIELEGGGGGTIVSGDNQFKSYLGGINATVEVTPPLNANVITISKSTQEVNSLIYDEAIVMMSSSGFTRDFTIPSKFKSPNNILKQYLYDSYSAGVYTLRLDLAGNINFNFIKDISHQDMSMEFDSDGQPIWGTLKSMCPQIKIID